MRNSLAQLRKSKNLTQEQLATKLGVSRQTVISIEKGRFDPSLPLAFAISREIGLPIEAIFFPDEK